MKKSTLEAIEKAKAKNPEGTDMDAVIATMPQPLPPPPPKPKRIPKPKLTPEEVRANGLARLHPAVQGVFTSRDEYYPGSPNKKGNPFTVPFKWNKLAVEACYLLAQAIPIPLIARKLSVSISDIQTYLQSFEFRLAVRKRTEEFTEHILTSGIAIQANRIAARNDAWMAAKQVIAARAEHPKMQEIPGGSTGFIGPDGGWDSGLDKAMRDNEKQVAIETGQWNEGNIRPTTIEVRYEDKSLIVRQDQEIQMVEVDS